jgi:uncharacterized protein (TIGR00369 family)
MAAPGARLLRYWRRLAPLPGGKMVFSWLVGWMTPYTGTLGARIEELEPGWCRASLRDRRRVRNHLASVHAMALANFAELASGLATLTALEPGVQGIVTGFTIDYVKKARGQLSAACRVSVSEISSEREQDAVVAITDPQGDVVAHATARWRLRLSARR